MYKSNFITQYPCDESAPVKYGSYTTIAKNGEISMSFRSVTLGGGVGYNMNKSRTEYNWCADGELFKGLKWNNGKYTFTIGDTRTGTYPEHRYVPETDSCAFGFGLNDYSYNFNCGADNNISLSELAAASKFSIIFNTGDIQAV